MTPLKLQNKLNHIYFSLQKYAGFLREQGHDDMASKLDSVALDVANRASEVKVIPKKKNRPAHSANEGKS